MKSVSLGIFRGSADDVLSSEFQSKSIRHVLDFESGAQVFGDNSPLREAILCDRNGVRVWNHPLGGIFAPKVSELVEAVEFLRSRKEPILIHCKWGKDRTGMVCAAYRIIVQRWSKLRAIKEMLSEGFHWYAYWYWIPQLLRLNASQRYDNSVSYMR